MCRSGPTVTSENRIPIVVSSTVSTSSTSVEYGVKTDYEKRSQQPQASAFSYSTTVSTSSTSVEYGVKTDYEKRSQQPQPSACIYYTFEA
jgi:predicted nucleic acid binding AN1-type Zn finger protein